MAKLEDFEPLDISVSSGIRRSGGYIYEDPIKRAGFRNKRELYLDMYRNEVVVGGHVYYTRTALNGLDYWLRPKNEGDEEALRQKVFVEGCLQDMTSQWEDIIDNMVLSMVYGKKFWEIVYKIRGGDDEDKQRNSKFDDGKIGWRKWMPIKDEAIDRYVWDDDDELCGIWVESRDNESKRSRGLLNIEKAIHFRAIAENENPEGVSVYQTAANPYCFKKHLQDQEAIAYQRSYGFPITRMPLEYYKPISGTDPASVAKEARRKAAIRKFTKVGTDIRNDKVTGANYPASEDKNGKTGFELEFAGNGQVADFDKPIRRYSHEIAEAVLWTAAKMGASNSSGNRSLSDNATELAAAAAEALNGKFKRLVTESVFPRLIRLNGWDPAHSPILESSEVSPESFEGFGDMLEALTVAGVNIQYPSAIKHILDKAGLPHPEDIDDKDVIDDGVTVED